MKITVVYDNEAKSPFIADWGFSCLIESRIRVLFDTGASPEILSHNLSLIGVDDFDYVVLSHEHYDHVGGLSAVIEKTSYVLALKTFSRRLKGFISSKAELIEVVEPIEFENFVTTGSLGRIVKEQSLVVKTSKGNFVITGCSHPGLDKILRKAEEFGDVFGVMGGFHGFSKLEILQSYDLVIPCHCTAYKREILKMRNAKPCFAGCSFEL
ncbi:MBL fold metallo-hydrolase [Archaeoglobus profundus]|uniref:Beta-lactamase domain protein n=1 Tax=Archaeoglobus profundus (strain DSM 5631 / JCM 9629 / NBRC 100127 / Av18) TaxID=572546 RepID=D2RI98_ARCPA|nr:MBL fold metallo-hydrolase [Archaeoglobus profundus]ADB58023.1 beta-lactamase domain protein [Archaeoglobus profundus DSM 5631]